MKNGGTNWNLKGRERAEHGERVKRLGSSQRERVKNRRRGRSWIWDLGEESRVCHYIVGPGKNLRANCLWRQGA